MPRLLIEDEEGNIKVVPIEAKALSIGRSEDNDIVLPERNVSRHHARLIFEGDRVYVEDAGARYGLFVNEERIDGRYRLAEGDVIGIGDYKLKVLPSEEAKEPIESPKTRPPTVPGIRSIAEPPKKSADEGEEDSQTGVISLRQMEEVARHGIPSEWRYGRPEEAERRQKRLFVLLVALLGVGIALLALYVFWIGRPTIYEEQETAQVAVEPGPESGARGEEATGASVSPPPTREEGLAESGGEEVKEERPSPLTKDTGTKRAQSRVETGVAKGKAKEGEKGLRAQLQVQSPGDRTAKGNDLYAEIRNKIEAQDLAGAEARLMKCGKGEECGELWRLLGNKYQGSGNLDKACQAWKKALSLIRKSDVRQRIEKKISAINCQ